MVRRVRPTTDSRPSAPSGRPVESARRRQFRPGLGLGLGLGLALLALAGAPSARAEIPSIPVAEITPGMQGYGLTVFRGSQVDTFGVTVVGVQRDVRVDGDLVLIRVEGHGLETSSVAQGMSGSPIYLDGRFAGALAFGWGGSLSPIAGVTPAAEMLALPASRPPEDGRQAEARMSAAAIDVAALVPAGGDVAALAAALGLPAEGGEGPAGAPLPSTAWPDTPAMWARLAADLARSLPAFAPDTRGWLIQPVGMAAAGTGSAAAAGGLVPGGACAVPLVTGDAALGAIGTVTWVDGDRVLMMGHPFMQRGPVNLPLATAEILTVLPSREMSFKMGTIGDLVGAVHHDLRAGLAGRLGEIPPLIPVSVEVGGEVPGGSYRFAVAEDPLLTPTLVFWSLYNALLATGDDASLQTMAFEIRSTWDGPAGLAAQPLVQRGVTAGPGGAAGLAAEVMTPLMALLNNAHAPVRLREVSATLESRRALEIARVTGLSSPRTVAQAGERIVFQAELDIRDGGTEAVEFRVDLPTHLAPGPYRVVLASAADLFALEAQRAPGRFEPTSLDGILDVLRLERSRDTLVLALLAPGASLVVQGRELQNLPESVARTVAAGNQQVQRSLADYVWRDERRTPWVVTGYAVRNLEVKPAPEPQSEERRP